MKVEVAAELLLLDVEAEVLVSRGDKMNIDPSVADFSQPTEAFLL